MITQTREYDLYAEVTFQIEEGVDLLHWVNPETGERQHRLEGIYSGIRTEAEVMSHLAYNAIFNGVTDASSLDGWASLGPGKIRMWVSGHID